MHVWTGRSSERDGMEGFAIDGFAIEGRSSEKGLMLGAYGSSRRAGAIVASGGEARPCRAASAREGAGVGVGVGEAAERRGSSKVLRSAKESLIA